MTGIFHIKTGRGHRNDSAAVFHPVGTFSFKGQVYIGCFPVNDDAPDAAADVNEAAIPYFQFLTADRIQTYLLVYHHIGKGRNRRNFLFAGAGKKKPEQVQTSLFYHPIQAVSLSHLFPATNKHKLLQILHRLLYWPPANALFRAVLKSIPGLPAKFHLHPCGQISVPLKNGKRMLLQTNQTCHVTAVVDREGSSAYEFTDVFQDIFPAIRCFFDVGSNIGYYSVMGGICHPELEIHAFDPSPGPFAYLCENLKLNQVKNAFPNQMALSDAAGKFSFHIAWNKKYPWLKYNSLGGSGHLSHVRENPTRHTVEVEALTLDAYAAKAGLKNLDLIKLDVEEAEHLVLAGASESIRKFRPLVVCEVFSGEMLQKIREQMLSQDYLAFRFDEESRLLVKEELTEDSFVGKIENYFFVPSEKTGLLAGHLKS